MHETDEERWYLDRIEGEIAVLLPEQRGDAAREVPRGALPEHCREGQWLLVAQNPAGVAVYRIDEVTTQAVKHQNQSLMDELAS